jgi:hypothetical protein
MIDSFWSCSGVKKEIYYSRQRQNSTQAHGKGRASCQSRRMRKFGSVFVTERAVVRAFLAGAGAPSIVVPDTL